MLEFLDLNTFSVGIYKVGMAAKVLPSKAGLDSVAKAEGVLPWIWFHLAALMKMSVA